jgi:hypothetical protein
MLSPEQITTIYCIVDDLLQVYPLKQDKRSQLCNSEIITIALVACFDFGGVYVESMRFLHQYGYISNLISKSRLSRRLSRLEPVAEELFHVIAYLFTQTMAQKEFILDSTPLEVCDNIRICRCRMLQGEEFRGYKASFRRYFYGLKLQLLTTAQGIPVSYSITEGSLADAAAMEHIALPLSAESVVYADAAYTDYNFEDELKQEYSIEWLSQPRSNSKRSRDSMLEHKINQRRKTIETVFSSLKQMFKRKLQAYDIESYMRKIKFFILAFQLKSII